MLELSEGMQLSTQLHVFPTIVNITCDSGFDMLDDTGNVTTERFSTTTCQYDGTWSFDVSNVTCQRK